MQFAPGHGYAVGLPLLKSRTNRMGGLVDSTGSQQLLTCSTAGAPSDTFAEVSRGLPGTEPDDEVEETTALGLDDARV